MLRIQDLYYLGIVQKKKTNRTRINKTPPNKNDNNKTPHTHKTNNVFVERSHYLLTLTFLENIWKQENPLADLMYEPWDKMVFIKLWVTLTCHQWTRQTKHYLSGKHTKKIQGWIYFNCCWTHLNTNSGRSRKQSLIQGWMRVLWGRRESEELVQVQHLIISTSWFNPRRCILNNCQEQISCSLKLWFWYCWFPLGQ